MHAHWWLNPWYLVSGPAKVHLHQCSTIHVLPSGLHDFQPYDLPILRKDLGAVPALLRRWIPEGPWEVNSTKLEVRDSKWKSSKPSSTTIDPLMEWKWNNMLPKRTKKRTERKNRCSKAQAQKLVVKPTSQQKGHRSSGSFDVDVVAQVFNVVHFLMLHAQVVGSRIVDSRIGPCLKWPTIWLFNMAMENPHFL